MATTSVTITATFAGDKPISALADLIAKREKFLKGETTEMAVTATTINIVTSLRADTQKAKLQATPDMFELKDTGLVGGWCREPGANTSTRCARVPGGAWRRDIRPVNLMGPRYIRGEYGHVYQIVPKNQNMTFEKSVNAPAKSWYVLCESPQIAIDYGIARITRYLQKSSGMAHYALGMAQAKVSNRPMSGGSPSGSRQMQIAASAAVVTPQSGDGTFAITVADTLNYSQLALKSGPASLDRAMMKAANRTAGIINKLAGYRLDEPIPTPFPEVARKR